MPLVSILGNLFGVDRFRIQFRGGEFTEARPSECITCVDASSSSLMHCLVVRTPCNSFDLSRPLCICAAVCTPGMHQISCMHLCSVPNHEIGRFGFSRDCLVIAGSGDNCNSLAGMGVVSAGGSTTESSEIEVEAGSSGGSDVMISLGTSDTLLGVTGDPSPTTTGKALDGGPRSRKGVTRKQNVVERRSGEGRM